MLLCVAYGTGCAKKVVAEFKRPPATASIPVPAPQPEVAEIEEVPVEPGAENSGGSEEMALTNEGPKPAAPPRSTNPPAVEDPTPVPPDTQLAAELGTLNPETREKLDRATSLLGAVDARPLSRGERQQAGSARAFVAQAKKAIREGDERRALVLLGKGLLLVEDLERNTRP